MKTPKLNSDPVATRKGVRKRQCLIWFGLLAFSIHFVVGTDGQQHYAVLPVNLGDVENDP